MTDQILDFDEIFNAYMAVNTKVWAHDRSQSVGASEAFDCIRKVWFGKLGEEYGFKPDTDKKDRWGATERGNLIENNFVVPALRAGLPKQFEIRHEGDNQVTHIVDTSSATPDGLITGIDPTKPLIVRAKGKTITIDKPGANCIGLECKSIDPRAFLDGERAKHRGQVIMQQGLTRMSGLWAPQYSVILYVNASFIDDITVFVIEFDEAVFKIGMDRAKKVYATEDPLRLLAEGKMDGACEHCHWQTACGEAIINGIPAKSKKPLEDPYQISLLDPLVSAYLALKRADKETKVALKVAAEDLKAALTDAKVRSVRSDSWGVTWSSRKGKKTLDKQKMQAVGIDPNDFMTEGNPFDVLSVTDRNEIEEDEND